MKCVERKEYIKTAKAEIVDDNVLRFKGVNFNIIESKTLKNGSKWYSAIADRCGANSKIKMVVIAVFNTDGTKTVTYSKYYM